MRILLLEGQDIYGRINTGGAQCARKNYDLICSVVGTDNVYCAIINNSKNIIDNTKYFRRANTQLESLISTLFLCRHYLPYDEKKIVKYIEAIDPDILFVGESMFGKLQTKINKKIRKVVFMQNVEVDYAKNRLKNGGIKFLPMYISTLFNEKKAMQNADKVICLNSRDAGIVEQLYKRKVDYYLPISFKDVFDISKVERNCNEKILIFIGSFFQPNYDGIRWFIENVMSELKQFKLLVIGKGFEDVRGELERENVEVVGTVENVDMYYYKYCRIVMPIRYGNGMKVKTAEAMMYGMKIFATDEALEGYEVQKVKGIHRCNNKKEFVNAIVNSYEHSISVVDEDVRKCYKSRYDIDVQQELMVKIITE